MEAGIADPSDCVLAAALGVTGRVVAGRGALPGAEAGGTGDAGLVTVLSDAAEEVGGDAAASVVPQCTQNFAPG